MADDIARIGIEFDTSSLRKGEQALRDIRSAGRQAASSLEGISATTQRASTGFQRIGGTVNVANAGLGRYSRNVRDAASSTRQFGSAAGEAARNTDRMADNFRTATSRAGGYSERMSATTSRQRNFGIGAQNAAFQVQDLVTQIASGTSATRSLGQQLPQLLGQFGVWGAVIGAVTAGGFALVDSLGAVENKTSDVEKATKNYQESLETANEFIERLNNNGLTRIQRLRQEKEEILQSARAMVEANQARLDELKLREQQDLFGAGRRKRTEEQIAEQQQKLAEAQEKLNKQRESINEALAEEEKRIKANTNAANDNTNALNENNEVRQSVLASLRESIRLEQLDERERFQTQKVMEAQNNAMERGNLLREQQVARIRETAGELFDMRNKTEEATEAADKLAIEVDSTTEIMTGAFRKVGSSIQENVANAIRGAGTDLVESAREIAIEVAAPFQSQKVPAS